MIPTDLEQRDRCHNTKIFNYKVKPIHLKDEDLLIEKIYKDLFEPAMRRSYEAGRLSHVPDSAYCISTAHALPAKAGEIPAIHVKFTTRRFLHTWVRHSKSVLKKFNTDRKLKPEDAVRCGRDLTEINSDAFGRVAGDGALHVPGGGLTGSVSNFDNFGGHRYTLKNLTLKALEIPSGNMGKK